MAQYMNVTWNTNCKGAEWGSCVLIRTVNVRSVVHEI